MKRFKIGALAIIESMIFLTGSIIMISILGILLSISFKSSFIPYLILSCWSIASLIVLGALVKALWEGIRFVELFDRTEEKKESSGFASVHFN